MPRRVRFSQVNTCESFTFNGKDYVKLPEMTLSCGSWGIIINCLWVREFPDPMGCPENVADYLLDNTLVIVK